MTVILSQATYWELFEESAQSACQTGEFDTTQNYPAQLGNGSVRLVELRDGLELMVTHYQPHDRLIVEMSERLHPLEYTFVLSGVEGSGCHSIRAGQYCLCGSGIAPSETFEISTTQPIKTLNVHIEPALFQQFWGDINTPQLERLFRSNQKYHVTFGQATTAMQAILQQILQCPHRSIARRMYLESKVWELMALLIEQTTETKKPLDFALKPDDIDRIHHAKEILLQRLDNPPSLLELARQVGLNDCTLKRGFRQVFGKTAFGYLHDYRLEQARQLLEAGQFNVSEIARTIGFANRSYFAAAFKKKFGLNPRDYSRKNSA